MSGGNVSDELVWAFRVGSRKRPTVLTTTTDKAEAKILRESYPLTGPLHRVTRRQASTVARAIANGTTPKGW